MLIKRECEHISKSRLRNVNLVHTERFRKRKPNFPLMFAVCQSYIDSSKNPFASSFGFAIPIVTPEQCLKKTGKDNFFLSCRVREQIRLRSLTFGVNRSFRPIYTPRKRSRKRKFTLMLVVYSLIFFAFAPAFAWCV